MAITPESVGASRVDMQPTCEHYLEFAMTGAVTASTTPMQRRDIASFLRAMVTRPPISVAPMYEAHRAVIGRHAADHEAVLAGVKRLA